MQKKNLGHSVSVVKIGAHLHINVLLLYNQTYKSLCLTRVRMWRCEPLKRQPTGPGSSAPQLTDWKRKVSQSPRVLVSTHPCTPTVPPLEPGHNLNPTLIIKNKKGASHGAKNTLLPTLPLAFSGQASQPIRCCN